MNRFYSSEQLGFAYKATGTSWRKIPILRRLPYLTGRKITIRLSLKALYEDQEWLQGVLRYEPPIILHADSAELEEWGDGFLLDDSQYSKQTTQEYPKYKFEKGKWWSKIVTVKQGETFIQPYSFKCFLILQNVSLKDNYITSSTEIAGIRMADIEMISDTKFWGWLIGGILAFALVVVGILNLIKIW